MFMPFPGRYKATTAPPHMRGGWTSNRISMLFLAALLPPLTVILFNRGNDNGFLMVLGLVMLLSLAWNIFFARLRRHAPTLDWAVSAASFALFVPATLPLWQIGLGFSFGIVVGEQLFGGRGWNFLNPVIVALAFLAFSFPGADYVPLGDAFALAVLPGAVLLLAVGLISWRILLGALLGLAFVIFVVTFPNTLSSVSFESLMLGPLAFGLVFFACDPISASSTNPGRWIYGVLGGLLIGVFGLTNEFYGAPNAIIFALLLSSIFAPLIDYFVIWLNALLRRRRYE